MIRVPLGDLRTAISNPSNYARSFKPGRGNGGPSKYGMFLHAIGEFHKTNDVGKAQDYLEASLTKNFKNVSELPDYVKKLEEYGREWRALGNSLIRYRDNVTIAVPKRFPAFSVSGQASRIDLIPSGGYGIWMFVRDQPDWDEDPRMPLLQMTYAERLGAEMQEVKVGVYDFETGGYATRIFTPRDVKIAQKGLSDVMEALSARFSA